MNKRIKYSVVFGNDHKNPLGAMQSLGQAGINSIAVCIGNRTGIMESSRFLKEIHFGNTAEDCVDILLKIVPDGEFGVITPCSDEAAITIDKNREKLKRKYKFAHSAFFSFEELSDKGIQTQLAREAGLSVPEFYTVMTLEDIPENPPFPCIVKPLIAMLGSKNDLIICNNPYELRKNIEHILPHNYGIIIQRYIDKEYECLMECCRFSDGRTIVPAIVKNDLHRLYPENVGLSSMHDIIPFEDEEFKQRIIGLLDLIGYVGLISVEFAKSKRDGKYYFFEFNIRNDGYNPCLTKAGVNINYYYVCDMLNLPFEIGEARNVSIISEIRHLQTLAHRQLSVGAWIKDLRKADGFTWYYKNDKKPFWIMITHALVDTTKARFKKVFAIQNNKK